MRRLFIYFLYTQILEIIVASKSLVSVVTVASNISTRGYTRFMLSAKAYGIHVINLSEDSHWNRMSMKIHLLREFLNKLHSEDPRKHVILFVDSYDVVFLSDIDEIVRRFEEFSKTKVFFSAEKFCSPAPSLSRWYPLADKSTVFPFLNAGGIIGYLPYMKQIVNYKRHIDRRDDQLYYTKIYLKEPLREIFSISLDHDSTIFLSLAGTIGQINVVNTTNGYHIEHKSLKQKSLIIHGQGSRGKSILKRLYNKYLKKQLENKIDQLQPLTKKITLKQFV